MPYAIILNDPRGFDLIVEALNAKAKQGCIASGDLAIGIQNCVFQVQDQNEQPEPLEPKLKSPRPKPGTPFTVHDGGKPDE